MNKLFSSLIVLTLLFSCGINKRDRAKQRHGYWNETKPAAGGMLTSKGRYRHGEQKGKWLYSFGDTLYQKDKIRKNIITTTYYYPDKLLMAKGQSRLDITKDGKRHWYKFGPWHEINLLF